MLRILPFLLLILLFSCSPQPEEAEMFLYNGDIYTVDTLQPNAEAIAILGDRIFKLVQKHPWRNI